MRPVRLAIALMVVVGAWGTMPAPDARAAVAGITIDYYPQNIPSDGGTNCTTGGTPFAVRVTVSGDVGQNFALKIRLGTGGCTWNSTTSTWTSDLTAFTVLPRGTIGAGGTATLWLYGRATSTATASLTVRARACDATFSSCPTPNIDSAASAVTLMNMTTSGGWLEETDGASRAGRMVVVKNGASIVGMYAAENNSVTEGYSYTPGGYRVAVPSCAGCGYTIETWLPSNPGTAVDTVNTLGIDGCPSDVAAGATTSLDSCTTPTAVTTRALSANAAPTAAASLIGLGAVAGAAALLIAARRRSRR